MWFPPRRSASLVASFSSPTNNWKLIVLYAKFCRCRGAYVGPIYLLYPLYFEFQAEENEIFIIFFLLLPTQSPPSIPPTIFYSFPSPAFSFFTSPTPPSNSPFSSIEATVIRPSKRGSDFCSHGL